MIITVVVVIDADDILNMLYDKCWSKLRRR